MPVNVYSSSIKFKGYDPTTLSWQNIHTDGFNRIKAQLDSIPNPSKLDVDLSTRASESTLSSVLAQLDVTLSILAKLKRWGKNIEPEWVHAGEVTAPAADTALVSKTVSAGKVGYIYGFFISAGEANDFKINWTSGGAAKSIRVPFSGKGVLQYADFIALNEGLGADAETNITITNVDAGGSGVIYQARLLYAEM